MTDFKLGEGALVTVIDKDAVLATTARAAGDFDNGTNLFPICDTYLTVQFNTTAPSANAVIAELYLLRGDGESSEVFPNGGDGTVGANVKPQGSTLAGIFATVSPSTSVDEVLIAEDIMLGVGNNRFVLENVSGQEYDATWKLAIKPRYITGT